MMRQATLVFVGGGAGAVSRVLLAGALASWGALLPILFINVIGAFLLGIIYVLADDVGLLRAETRLFIAVGLLGGFTTFSTLAWDTATTAGGGNAVGAAAYMLASVVGGIGAVRLGIVAGSLMVDVLERAALAILIRLRHSGRAENALAHVTRIESEDHEESA